MRGIIFCTEYEPVFVWRNIFNKLGEIFLTSLEKYFLQVWRNIFNKKGANESRKGRKNCHGLENHSESEFTKSPAQKTRQFIFNWLHFPLWNIYFIRMEYKWKTHKQDFIHFTQGVNKIVRHPLMSINI